MCHLILVGGKFCGDVKELISTFSIYLKIWHYSRF